MIMGFDQDFPPFFEVMIVTAELGLVVKLTLSAETYAVPSGPKDIHGSLTLS